VTNADRVRMTGNKMQDKRYERYSGYPGGLKGMSADKMLEKHPEDVIRLAVKRMLPSTKLGDEMLKKLKVYAGSEHPHTYHQPEPLEIS
ncbi:MAG: 50S ribosomal protein L13, partial [Planctomycetota bacterium]